MLTYDRKKSKVNILLNINNFYGRYTGGLTRMLIFILAALAPFMVYTLAFINILPFKAFLCVYLPYVLYVFLLIVGRQRERVEEFKKQRNDEYASANDLIRVVDIHDDGCVEYANGVICYILQAYGFSYYNDDVFSKDIEGFIAKIFTKYEVDYYGHLVVGELVTSVEDLEKLRVYTDKEFLKERWEYYKYQDYYTNNNSTLYRMNFVIRAYKSDWFNLKTFIETLLKSEYVHCFDSIKICNRDEAVDVMSRDLTVYVDIGEMLRNKHSSANYFGSKVLYFGDDVPEKYIDKSPTFEEEVGRRVIDDK